MRGAGLSIVFALAGCDAIFGSSYQPDAPTAPADAAPLPDLMIAPPTDECFLATFPGDSIGKQWGRLFDNPRIGLREDSESGLVVELREALAKEYNGVLAARAFNLAADGRVEAKISIYPNVGQSVALLVTAANPDRYYEILVAQDSAGTAYAYLTSQVPNPMFPIVGAGAVIEQRYVRIRQEGVAIFFETSRDGDTWEDSVRLGEQPALDGAAVWLLGGVNENMPMSSGNVGWDDVEIRWTDCTTPSPPT